MKSSSSFIPNGSNSDSAGSRSSTWWRCHFLFHVAYKAHRFEKNLLRKVIIDSVFSGVIVSDFRVAIVVLPVIKVGP
jgi:hypothetical protein